MTHILNSLGGWVLAFAAAIVLSVSAAQAQSTWETIQSTGKLRMGVTQAPPWYSKNPSIGEWDSGSISLSRQGNGRRDGCRA